MLVLHGQRKIILAVTTNNPTNSYTREANSLVKLEYKKVRINMKATKR